MEIVFCGIGAIVGIGFLFVALAALSRTAGDPSETVGCIDGCGQLLLIVATLIAMIALLA